MQFNELYKSLASIDCSSFTEKKKDLTYLSWTHAWNAVASRYDISYEVVKFDGKPYFFDESLGYYVETKVTIDGHIRNMQLFVMDGANNAMTNTEWTYEVDEWYKGKKTGNKIEKTVNKATMFEINTAIMRCLTKNLAIFGLGINIYAGEDLPLIDEEGNLVDKIQKQPIQKESHKTGGETPEKWFNEPDFKKWSESGFNYSMEAWTQWMYDEGYTKASNGMKKKVLEYISKL